MSDKRQEFINNFNNYENTRFDFGIALLRTISNLKISSIHLVSLLSF